MAIDTRQLDALAIRFSKSAVNAETTAEGTPLMRAFERIGIKLVGYIKANKLSGNPIHRRSGKLSQHIDYTLMGDGKAIVLKVGVVRGEQDVPYAKWLEGGSRPHQIVARNAKALRWSSGGAAVFAKSVMHPGTPAFRFLRSSLQENRQMITQELRAAAAAMAKGE